MFLGSNTKAHTIAFYVPAAPPPWLGAKLDCCLSRVTCYLMKCGHCATLGINHRHGLAPSTYISSLKHHPHSTTAIFPSWA
jgi:hypothetical protein